MDFRNSGNFTIANGLQDLLMSLACSRNAGYQEPKRALSNFPLPTFKLSSALKTAPARLLNDRLFGVSQLQRSPMKMSAPADSGANSSSAEVHAMRLNFNRTYTLEDQVRHRNFLEDAASVLKKVEVCAFCKRNGSPFFNHPLKDSRGGTVCPVLSRFTCKMCAATGREAHTHKYCKNNPYTRGDPVAVGMAPGPSVKNPTKTHVKVDPSIDLNDIYGVQRYYKAGTDHSFQPVKRLDSTRARLFDEDLRVCKKIRKDCYEDAVAVDDNSNYLDINNDRRTKQVCRTNEKSLRISHSKGNFKTSDGFFLTSSGKDNNRTYVNQDTHFNKSPVLYDLRESGHYNERRNKTSAGAKPHNYNLGKGILEQLNSRHIQNYANSPPRRFEKLASATYDLSGAKRNTSKRSRKQNRSKKNSGFERTQGSSSLEKELVALQNNVRNSNFPTSKF